MSDQYLQWELNDAYFSIERMQNRVQSYIDENNLVQSKKAMELMLKYHAGQFRKGKDSLPYIIHPLMMACHALGLGINEDSIIASCLLHDVVEDCDVTSRELDVSDEIREAIDLLSFKVMDGKTKAESKEIYFTELAKNRISAIVKVLDRCNNVSTMATGFSKEKICEYITETETYVMPLLKDIKHNYTEYSDAAFLLKYQMRSVMETLKRVL